MSGSVDDIDFVSFVIDRNILGEDRDSPFALKIIIVKNKFSRTLILAEQIAGHEHFIHHRGFAMVHVGYNGDVSNLLHILGNCFKGANLLRILENYPKFAGKTDMAGISVRASGVTVRCAQARHRNAARPTPWQ